MNYTGQTSFAEMFMFPDYLHDRLADTMKLLGKEVLAYGKQ